MRNIALYTAFLGFSDGATIACAVLFLALLVVSYDRYRIIKESKDRLYQQKQVIDHKMLELTQVNLSRTRLLAEKEWLLREIHHRVKN